MLNISGIHEGFVLDHIQAGMSMRIYRDLKLDRLDCTVAIIKNASVNTLTFIMFFFRLVDFFPPHLP